MDDAYEEDLRPIGVVGAGRMGLALAHRIAQSGRAVILLTSIKRRATILKKTRRVVSVLSELDELDKSVEITVDPRLLASSCTLVFLTVSDAYFRRLLDPLGEHLDGAHQIVHAVHSLHGRSLQRTSEMIRHVTCVRQVGVLAGPLHVGELLDGMPNAAVIASEFPALIRETQAVLNSDDLMIGSSADFIGVELAAALHQLVTLAIGISDGLNLGAGMHATLASTGLAEISELGVRLGGSHQSFYGVAGMGRLVDALHRGDENYVLGGAIATVESVGVALGAAPPEAKSAEIVRHLASWAEEHGAQLRMVDALAAIFDGRVTAEVGLRQLMRDRGHIDGGHV